MRKLKAFTLMSVVFFAIPAHSEDGPSYEETTAFILKKLDFQDVCDGHACEITYSFPGQCVMTQVSLTKYTAEQNVDSFGRSGGWAEVLITKKASLRDFDPSLVGIQNSGRLDILTNDERDLISTQIQERRQSSVSTNGSEVKDACGRSMAKSGRTFVSVCNGSDRIIYISPAKQADLERLQKAFTHLIKLCGGEEELF